LAERVGGHVRGNPERVIRGIDTLDRCESDQLGFLTNPRYRKLAEETRAAAILVAPNSDLTGHDLLEAEEPYLALAALLALFHPRPERPPGISPDARVAAGVRLGRDVRVEAFAVVEEGARLGDAVVIGSGCVVGAGSSVGAGSELRPRVVLYPDTTVGSRCLIHAGVVLGGDGFGFATSGGKHHKVPQTGRVVIEDDVEVGSNATIDRGAIGDTVIEEGAKLDNLVMVAHGVRVGSGSLLAAQSGVAGSTRLGRYTTLAGQAGVTGHVEIAGGTTVAAKSAVLQDVTEPDFVAGIPAVHHREWKRAQASLRRLPRLRAELRELRERVAELERRARTATGEEDSA
jgi:UDP-3-O-[3-hydroxymyristoyl] glucosamine N-acyltransferase